MAVRTETVRSSIVPRGVGRVKNLGTRNGETNGEVHARNRELSFWEDDE